MLKKFFTLSFIACVFSTATFASPESLDKVLAVVNNTPITENQIAEQVQMLKQQMQAQHAQIPSDETLRHQVLEQTINETLLLQRAKESGISISEQELNDAISKIAEDNHMSVAELKSHIAEAGISFEDYRKKMKDGLMIHNLEQHEVASSISVTQQEIKDYLKNPNTHARAPEAVEYRLRDILITLPENATAPQLEKANSLANSLIEGIKTGKALKELTTSLSTPEYPIQENDLNWRKKTELPELFASYVSSMKIGSIEGPITAPNGIHIIQLINKRSDAKDLSENEVKNLLFKNKIEEKLTNWIKQLRDGAYIKIY